MKLDPKKHSWMRTDGVKAIMKALPDGTARFVGGCVRNSLMGEPIGDIDIATQLVPKEAGAALKAAGIKIVPTGIEHGTITAVHDSEPYEITSLRKDVETDGRRAVVAFTKDWAEDAYRRDFTVNAIYADYDGNVYDPTGGGLEDIKSRKFQFVGDGEQRVREDYLRILRFFRFMAWYAGDAKVDAQALKACRENRAGLKTLSAERVWSELKKILMAPHPARAVQIMLTNDILPAVLPEASNAEGLALMQKLEKRESLKPDPLLRLMAMSGRDEFAIAGLAKRLRVSNDEKARLLSWAGNQVPFTPDMDARMFKQGIYASTPQTAYDRMVVRGAGESDPIVSATWVKKAVWAKDWPIPEFPLKGRDLKSAGVKNGPEMGRILRALKELWVRSGFEADQDKLLVALAMIHRN